MEHHDYKVTITENPTEVKNSARLVVGGNNNFFHTLKNNGYTTQCIHQGTYLLLQGGTTYLPAKKVGVLKQGQKYNQLINSDH